MVGHGTVVIVLYSCSMCTDPARFGVIFLNEDALGKENTIFKDHTLEKPPNEFDSVVAPEFTEPNMIEWFIILILLSLSLLIYIVKV